MAFNGTIANPDSALTIDQRSMLVKLLGSKIFNHDEVVIGHDGEAVVFEDDSEVTFGDLASWVPRADDAAKRHFPVVCGLTKGQASGAIAALVEMPQKPKASNGGGRPAVRQTAAKPQTPAKPEPDIEAMIATAVAKVLGFMPDREPAKPVVSTVTKLVRPAKPVIHNVPEIALETEFTVAGAEGTWVIRLDANGRPGVRRP